MYIMSPSLKDDEPEQVLIERLVPLGEVDPKTGLIGSLDAIWG
jgi:hypothetical protein